MEGEGIYPFNNMCAEYQAGKAVIFTSADVHNESQSHELETALFVPH